VFGPSPRDYSYRINKKVRKSALRSALSSKLKENNLILVDTIHLPEIKTKTFISLLERLDIQDALIVDDGNTNLEKSAQNVPLFKVVRPEGLNVYDILKREKLVITQASLEKITRNLSA